MSLQCFYSVIETNSKLDYRKVSKVITLIAFEFSTLLLSILLEAHYFQGGPDFWMSKLCTLQKIKSQKKCERNTF